MVDSLYERIESLSLRCLVLEEGVRKIEKERDASGCQSRHSIPATRTTTAEILCVAVHHFTPIDDYRPKLTTRPLSAHSITNLVLDESPLLPSDVLI